MAKRQTGFYNTGTLLSDEMRLNPFLVVFKQSESLTGEIQKVEGVSLLMWVLTGYLENYDLKDNDEDDMGEQGD